MPCQRRLIPYIKIKDLVYFHGITTIYWRPLYVVLFDPLDLKSAKTKRCIFVYVFGVPTNSAYKSRLSFKAVPLTSLLNMAPRAYWLAIKATVGFGSIQVTNSLFLSSIWHIRSFFKQDLTLLSRLEPFICFVTTPPLLNSSLRW